MTLVTSDYREDYLTLGGGVVHNGIGAGLGS